MKVCLLRIMLLIIVIAPHEVPAQEKKAEMEVYGFIVLDAGYNFDSIDPAWYDVMRPTKLPAYDGEFDPAGNVFFSVRQTRVGVRTLTSTPLGDLKTRFDFDLYGFGDNAGQTTFHLVNAFAELGRFGIGQTPSVIMDTDVFPVTLDYWGPTSRTFFLNIQVRYTPADDSRKRIVIGLERPGATADGSDYRTHIDMENVEPQFPLPNLTAHYRRKATWGYVQLGGIAKLMKWNDLNTTTPYDLSGHDIGWGFNLGTVVKVNALLTLKAQAIYGEGIQNYVADAPTDVALQRNADNPAKPFTGKALPIGGLFAFAELNWTAKLRSTLGYSFENIDNTDMQRPDAFRRGQYALMNIRYYPADNVQVGIEYQYGRRDNFSDGFSSAATKVQVSAKVNFSTLLTAP